MDDQFDTNSVVDFTGISLFNLDNDVVCCVYQDGYGLRKETSFLNFHKYSEYLEVKFLCGVQLMVGKLEYSYYLTFYHCLC